MSERILIFDTTLRDGEQSPGCSMTVSEKVEFAHRLERLGVDIIEAGFPVASEGDAHAVRAIALFVQHAQVAALARCRREDIDIAWAAVREARKPRLHLFLATSDIHLAYKLKIDRATALAQVRECVAYAKSLCPDVEFSPEDATRSDVTFLCEILNAAVAAGATTLNIPDTVGYTTPEEYAELIRTIRSTVQNIDQVVISTHCHNDLGLAVANSLAGVRAGARQVECTINGIGERAGNAALEEIVMALHVRQDHLPFTTNVDKAKLYSTSQALSAITGSQVQPNKAIVGRNAFAHEAGIHQHGVLSNPLTYEIMTPESVGATAGSRLVLGKHSGRRALAVKLDELGFTVPAHRLHEIYEKFTALADRKKTIYDQDLISLMQEREQAISPARAAAAVMQ